jgi:Protein of unknown function (DUF3908)
VKGGKYRMSEINYTVFKELMKREAFADFEIEDQLSALEELIIEEKIKVFYPQNIFSEKRFKDVNLYLFEENKLRLINFLDNGKIKITTRNYDDIKKIELIYKTETSSILKIDFGEGEIITFDDSQDMGKRRRECQKKILSIYKLLS